MAGSFPPGFFLRDDQKIRPFLWANIAPRFTFGEVSSAHKSLATGLWLQTMVPLTVGDTVVLQGYFRVADGYIAADQTSFWGAEMG
ncbi:MAG: hypothetical protein ACE5DK_02265 [Paracoccaceae bacterium]